nr:tetratricopeptide repeat protein [Phormidesmis priestleyi]
MPYSGVSKFVGRDDDLETLHKQLQAGTTVAISAIAGMGGIGKTELAWHYADFHAKAETYPGGVCWLKAREDVGLQIIAFARSHLDLKPPDEGELVDRVQWCWRHWQDGATLLILDDVQTYDDIRSLLPRSESRFKVLLTTRSRFGSPVKTHEIKVLSEAASLDLLRSLVSDGRVDQDLATAKRVCDWLGYLPLGLELVGRYLARKKGTSIAKLWERLQEKRLAAQALLKTETSMTASLGVTAAFELSWQELNEDAQQLAALLSLFALAEIPWGLVQGCLPEADEEALDDLRDEQLVNLSLLSYEREGIYQLHQLLREFFRTKIGELERKPLKTALATVLIKVAKQIPQDPTLEVIKSVTLAIPHLQEVAEDLSKLGSRADLFIQDDDDLFWAFVGIGRFYQGQGFYAEAEPWYRNCLAVVRSLLGESHPGVVSSLNNLAGLYHVQGRYEEAEPLYLQALQLQRSLLGESHPDVATSLNNLAELYRAQGRYEEAEPLYLQALQLQRSLLGESHPFVATSLNNLAALYRAQGRYEAAEPLYLQALQLRRSLLGESHPSVAMSLNNLAVLYANQGRLTDAEPLLVQALERYQRLLGHQHPDTVMMRQSLEYLRQVMGKTQDEG